MCFSRCSDNSMEFLSRNAYEAKQVHKDRSFHSLDRVRTSHLRAIGRQEVGVTNEPVL